MDLTPEEPDQVPLQATLVSCSIKLSKEQGSRIKDLINDIYPHTFPHYCLKVGVSTPNFYNTLNGERTCTLEFLNKILSGIHYQAIVINPEIVIQELEIGEIVKVADSITLDEELQSNESEDQDIPDCYS
jgi:hypothetical protein